MLVMKAQSWKKKMFSSNTARNAKEMWGRMLFWRNVCCMGVTSLLLGLSRVHYHEKLSRWLTEVVTFYQNHSTMKRDAITATTTTTAASKKPKMFWRINRNRKPQRKVLKLLSGLVLADESSRRYFSWGGSINKHVNESSSALRSKEFSPRLVVGEWKTSSWNVDWRLIPYPGRPHQSEGRLVGI